MAMSRVIVRMNGVPDSIYSFIGGERVYELKIKIECNTGMKREDQLLLLGPVPLIQDYKILSLYGIIDGSIINLHEKHKDTTRFEVTIISEDGDLMGIIHSVPAYDNVLDLKEYIGIKIGVFIGRQSVLYQDAELFNNDLMRDFSVTLQPTVTLAMKPGYLEFMFNVKVVEGKSGRLMEEVLVHPMDRVCLLEWRARRLEETGGRAFQLFCGSMALGGLETMKLLGVRLNTVFSLIFRDDIL